jgi:hypothetical protein
MNAAVFLDEVNRNVNEVKSRYIYISCIVLLSCCEINVTEAKTIMG